MIDADEIGSSPVPHPQFNLRAFLEALLWGKNGPPPGYTAQFSLGSLIYVVTAISVLLAIGRATQGMERADDICAAVFFGFVGLWLYLNQRRYEK